MGPVPIYGAETGERSGALRGFADLAILRADGRSLLPGRRQRPLGDRQHR